VPDTNVYISGVIIVIKRTFIIVFSIAMLLSIGLIIKPQSAFACSCAASFNAEQQVKDELERKTAMFAGTVIQVKQPRQMLIMSSADLVKVTFDVSRVWKGELSRQTVVYTAMSSASCGVENFEVGTEYIVSAYMDDKALETNICDLTKPIASAGAELAILGNGYAPTIHGDASGSSLPMSIMTMIATVLIGGLIVLIIIRRNKTRS
jgi:hypothetical protein